MADLGSPRYVRFTNFRKDGSPVSTPVWFAAQGDGWVFSSNADTGKVKRLRSNPAVEIATCDVRGRVKPGTSVFGGTARLLDADAATAAEDALAKKYGLQWKLIELREKLGGLFGRRSPDSAYIGVTLGEELRTERAS